MLHELSTPDNYNVTFDYHGPTGLLKTKLDSTGRSYVYNYDEFGRLTSAITPTGKVISLSFDLSVKGATVKVTQNNRKPVSMLIRGSSVVSRLGEYFHFLISVVSRVSEYFHSLISVVSRLGTFIFLSNGVSKIYSFTSPFTGISSIGGYFHIPSQTMTTVIFHSWDLKINKIV